MPKLSDVKAKPIKEEPRVSMVGSNEDLFNTRRIVIIGGPKVGKTRTAATLSEFCPLEIPPKEKVVLEDTLWLSADADALETLRALRIKTDEIKLWQHFQTKDDNGKFKKPQDVLDRALDEVFYLVNKGNKSLVVVDTLSAIDDMFELYYERTKVPLTNSGNRDSFGIHRLMTADHEWFWTNLNSLPCNVVFLFHLKTAGEAAMAKAKTDGLPRGPSITNSIIDTKFQDTANIYRRHNSLICSVQVEKDERVLYTRSYNGTEGGNRYEHILGLREEPNLKKIFTKIDNYIKGNQT